MWDKSAGREVINEEDKLLVFTTGRKVRTSCEEAALEVLRYVCLWSS